MFAVHFGLNHMVAPRLDLAAFFALARRLDVGDVEIRNDLPGLDLLEGTSAGEVGAMAADAGLAIASINALQRFNHWTDERAQQARALIDYAGRCGARALVLCPVNDPAFTPAYPERLAMLREALTALRPMLEDAGVIGLVEPLGFAECSLRLKSEAVDAIAAVGGKDRFRLVHDTFHHHVAGEAALFPDWTGLIHTSGVTDRAVPAGRMRDPHRVLVDGSDLIGNVGQIRSLLQGGYAGIVSFEPFAAEVHTSSGIETDLRDSMAFISHHLRQAAA